MAYKVIDLFAGAGGLSLGFMQTGRFEIVAAAENNPGARKTYKRNHKLARLYPDVRTIDYTELEESCGEIDVVIGGPPCQGFSNANRQHTTIISMNNRLVKEYVRAVRELEPKAIVFDVAAVALERTGPHCARLVFCEPAIQPLAQGHPAVLGQLHITVALDVLVELVQQCLLRLGVDMTEQRLAVFLVANDDAAFPASVLPLAYHAVTGRSSFCHVLHFLWIHFLFATQTTTTLLRK